MRSWMTCIALMLFPALASAGPWAREKGATFLSLSYSMTTPMDAPGDDLQRFGALYLERGLGRRLTFGLDAGMDGGEDYSAILFLRRELATDAEHSKFAYQGGIGAVSADAGNEILLQGGASWGRGVETRFGPGWVVLDVSAQYNIAQKNVITKADLTLGLKPVKRTKLMMQLQVGSYPGSDPYLRLAPSVARQISERLHVELGAQIGVIGDDRTGLKLGTWLEF